MPFTLHSDGSILQLMLTGEVTIASARELADALSPALKPGTILAIDATQLVRLDAAILQILLAGAQVAADTTLLRGGDAWSAAFTRYGSPDPFHA